MRKKRKLRAKAAKEAEARAANAEAAGAEAAAEAESASAAEAEAAEASADGGDTEASDKPTVPEGDELCRILESLLFVAEGPLTVNRMRQLTRVKSNQIIREALEKLMEDYSQRGIVLYKVSGGYQFRSNAASSHWVQKLVVGKPVRLSRAQLETLAIIAYRQPITRPEIDDIRGVDSASTLRLLLERDLIRVLGKKEEPGRPLLYGSTPEFLEFFNLNDLRDLPTLREYHELTDESMAVVEDTLGEDVAAASIAEVMAPAASEDQPEDGDDGDDDGSAGDGSSSDSEGGGEQGDGSSQAAADDAGDEELAADAASPQAANDEEPADDGADVIPIDSASDDDELSVA